MLTVACVPSYATFRDTVFHREKFNLAQKSKGALMTIIITIAYLSVLTCALFALIR